MRLLASIVGDLRQVLAAEVRAGERAAMTAVRAETREVQQELRRQVTTAFGAKARGLANAWRAQVYPRGGPVAAARRGWSGPRRRPSSTPSSAGR